jgi:hypothetical protein
MKTLKNGGTEFMLAIMKVIQLATINYLPSVVLMSVHVLCLHMKEQENGKLVSVQKMTDSWCAYRWRMSQNLPQH